MLIAKSSLLDLFFFCRQLVSTQLRGGLGVYVRQTRVNYCDETK